MNNFKVALIANDDHPIPDWVDEKFKQAGIHWAYKQCYNRADLQEVAADANVLWLMSGRKGLVTEYNMDIFKNLIAVVRIAAVLIILTMKPAINALRCKYSSKHRSF